MIEVNKPQQTNVEPTKTVTPNRITTSMIIEDLENGIDRKGIQEKYSLAGWEVTQIFQHPTLKGRKVKKVKKLSFEFVDDTIDPNQMTISDADEMVSEMKNEMEREMTYPSPTQQTAEAVSAEFADGQDDDDDYSDDDDDNNETNY